MQQVINLSFRNMGAACYIASRYFPLGWEVRSVSFKEDYKFEFTAFDTKSQQLWTVLVAIDGNKIVHRTWSQPVLTPTPKKTRTRKAKEAVA